MSHGHNLTINHANKKNTGWIFAGVGVVVVLLGVFLFFSSSPTAGNQSTNTSSVKSSVLQASEQAFDFGTISMAKGKVIKNFKIKNPTDQPVVLRKLYTSCMCTSASVSAGGVRKGPFGMPGHGSVPTIGVTVGGGEEAEIEVIFDPAAHGPAGVGPIARNVFVETTDGGKLALEIKANVTP